ncbi:MAG: HAD hydrolase family protein [Muribaculaceae bacterium]|nr:HAD hydrolase family protein [Muribaculaceae bacterium]
MSRINYDLQTIRALAFDIDGVLSPTVVPMGPDGVPQRMANLKDGYAMVQAVRKGLKIVIVSGALCPGLRERFHVIGLSDDDINLNVSDKLTVLREWAARNGMSSQEIAYVGDDIPDLGPMRWAGLAVAPRDACSECRALAGFITLANGGYGVARELIEEVMRTQGTWPAYSTSAGY